MRAHDELFAALAKSGFRSRFRLRPAELRYLTEKGLAAVIAHACEFVNARLAPTNPENDGRQTPMGGHPVFVAQHATATCCRSCLAKWHGIAEGAPLSSEEVDYVVGVVAAWIERQAASTEFDGTSHSASRTTKQPPAEQRLLF